MSPHSPHSGTTSLDHLFSPERLRQNWQPTVKHSSTPADAAPTMEEESAHSLYQRFRALINQRFKGDDAEVLNLLLDELETLLHQESEDDRNLAAHDVLNRIEDLAEAFEMAGRGH